MRENRLKIETIFAFKTDSRTTNISMVKAEIIKDKDWLIKISRYDYNEIAIHQTLYSILIKLAPQHGSNNNFFLGWQFLFPCGKENVRENHEEI